MRCTLPGAYDIPRLTAQEINAFHLDWRNRWYGGLPSCPRLVATSQSRADWKQVSTLDCGFPAAKILMLPFVEHPLYAIWQDTLAPKVRDILDRVVEGRVCLDVVGIGDQEETECVGVCDPGVMVIWIGVPPNSLTEEDGASVVEECKGISKDARLEDVAVEIRETLNDDLGITLIEPDAIPYTSEQGIEDSAKASYKTADNSPPYEKW
jgi:hypothetical protein